MLMNVSHLLEEWMTNILTRGLKGARTAVVPRLLLASGIQWRLIIQCPLQLCWLARQALDLRSLCKAKNFGYFSAHFMEIILKFIKIHVKLDKFYRYLKKKLYLYGVNAAKAIRQEAWSKRCSPFAISVNIIMGNTKDYIIWQQQSELSRHSMARQPSRLKAKQSERNRIQVRRTIVTRQKSCLIS